MDFLTEAMESEQELIEGRAATVPQSG